MLKAKATKQEKKEYLLEEDIERFPCTDLRTIDKLWVEYSNKRFGFSIQKQIWESVRKPSGNNDYETDKKFGECVGWYIKEKDKWLLWTQLTFDKDAPRGHLPWAAVCVGQILRAQGIKLGENFIVKGKLILAIDRNKLLFNRTDICQI